MKVKLSVFVDTESIIDIPIKKSKWNEMDDAEQEKFIYDNYLNNFIDNNIESDYEVLDIYSLDEFIDKVSSEYYYAKKNNFKDIEVEVETDLMFYGIYEYCVGFMCDILDCKVYSELEELSTDLYLYIEKSNEYIKNVSLK